MHLNRVAIVTRNLHSAHMTVWGRRNQEGAAGSFEQRRMEV